MKRRPLLYSLLPLLILAAVVFGLYLGWDSLQQRLLALVTDRLQLSNLDVQDLQLNADGVQARSIHIVRQDGNQDLDLELQDVKLGFSVFPLDLTSLVVARGTLDMSVVTETNAQVESTSVSEMPRIPTQLLDLESMRIASLTTNIRFADNNQIGFVGSGEWTSDGDEVFIKLVNDNERISIKSDSELRSLALQLSNPADSENPLRVELFDPVSSNTGFTATATLATLNNWLSSTDLIPIRLRDAVDNFQQTNNDIEISSARIQIDGNLDRDLDWPVGPLTLGLDTAASVRDDCQITASLRGTLRSTDSHTGTFVVDEERTISASNCIDLRADKSPSRLLVRPATGLSVSYDLTAADNPVIDVAGAIQLDIEQQGLSASFAGTDIQITDALNKDGFPDATAATIVADVSYQDFAQQFDETSVRVASINASGSFEISQTTRGSPYDLKSNDFKFKLNQLNAGQAATGLIVDQVNGSGTTALQLTPSKTGALQVKRIIDLSTDLVASEITFSDDNAGLNVSIFDAHSNGQVKGVLGNGEPALSATFDYKTNSLSLSEPEVSADALSGKARIQLADTLAIDTTLTIANITGAPPLPPLLVEQVDGSLQLDNGKIDGSGIATLATALDVPWTLTKRLDRVVLGSSIIADVATLYEWLQPALGTLSDSISLTEGRVRMDSEFEFDNDNRSIVATGSATGLSGGFEEVNFSQANVTMNAADLLTQKIDLGVSIANGEFANGSTFSDLASDVRIDGSEITIDRFATRSFDAGFSFSDLIIGKPGTVPASIVEVDGLNLSVVTSELAKEQLNASGTMSGEIPFQITDRGVAIDDGRLESDGNGSIAYRSGGTEQNIEGLNNIALQALENFQYDKVELKLGYTEEGEYLAGFRLSGNNPDLYDGYPIVLNLNINGQLPGLLRSSLIGGSFDEEILRTLPQNPIPTDN